MTSAQWWLGISVQCAVLFTISGLFMRDEVRKHWALTLYLLAVAGCGSLILSDPERWWHYQVFVVKESIYSVARVLIAAQLAHEVFSGFPGARRTSKRMLLIGLVLSTLWIGLSRPGHPFGYPTWQAQILAATTCLMAGTALVSAYYRIPVGPMHSAVLRGFALYLLLSTTVLNLLTHYGAPRHGLLGLVDGLAYLGMILWWGVTVWRTDGERMAVAA